MTPLTFIDQVLQANLDRLATMAKVAAFTDRERVTYGLVTEALILQRSPASDYVIFPPISIGSHKGMTEDTFYLTSALGVMSGVIFVFTSKAARKWKPFMACQWKMWLKAYQNSI